MQDFFIFVSEQWMLFSALTLILILMAITSKPPKNEITSHEAVKLINNGNIEIYDIRSADEYRKYHIINAKNSKLNEINLKDTLSSSLLIYGDESFKLIREVNKLIKNQSEENKSKVFVLSMGIKDWIREDYPVISGKSSSESSKKSKKS